MTCLTPFQKDSRWLVNNPAMPEMPGKCTCPPKGRHLRLESSFTSDSVKKFVGLCRPDCITVFGREPQSGEALCKFSGTYPIPAMQKLLELQLPALTALKTTPQSVQRPARKPPRWIGDLGRSLQWNQEPPSTLDSGGMAPKSGCLGHSRWRV